METKTCKYCGLTIIRKKKDRKSAWERRKFCDYSCAITYRNLQKYNGDVIKQCLEFLARSKKISTGCMEMQGIKKSGSYGLIRIANKSWIAHRAIYNFLIGKIPRGKFVLHSCDNPACINPEHLFLGSQSDNMQDMLKKERGVRWGKPMLTKKKKLEILDRISKNEKKSEIARHFNVCLQTIYNIYYKQEHILGGVDK